METCFEKKYKIESSLADLERRYSIIGIQMHMQDAVSEHTAAWDIDAHSLKKNSNAFWVILKTKICVFKQLQWNTFVDIKTYPLPPSLVRCDRECFFYDETGELAVSCETEWCILDCDTGKPRRVSSVCYPHDLEHMTERAEGPRPKRIVCDFSESDFSYERIIRLTDLDMNYHTNNISYTRFAIDAFSAEELKKNVISEYEINFENQSYEGETLRIYKKQIGQNKYVVCGRAANSGRNVFISEITMASCV